MPSKSGSKKGSKKSPQNAPTTTAPGRGAEFVARPDAVAQQLLAVPTERGQFRELLLANPNYFGTLKSSPFKPVKPMPSNTTYEELMCVGLNPQLDQLEAVVYLKRNNGYGSGVCGSGTPEYVRFYLTYDNGATWEDAGVVSFTAYDLPGPMPVEFAVTLLTDVRKRLCSRPQLPRVRAILSWNQMPTANSPGFVPVWGNVREAVVQAEPLRLRPWVFPLIELQSVFADLQLAPDVLNVLNQSLTLASAQPVALKASELHASYSGKNVPDHRTLFPVIRKQLSLPSVAPPSPLLTAAAAVAPLQPTVLGPPGVMDFAQLIDIQGVDLSKIIGLIQQTDGNTNFEELRCVGLDTNNDWLVGVLTVKLPNGYSGSLCSRGSREYVAFWVDWGDGAGWQHVGTTSVRVHDLNNIPPGGIQYAVIQPINTVHRRRPCNQGAVTARIRATLSWEEEPPAGNPNWVPTWGNREETRVLIKPGPQVIPGDVKMYLESVGGQPVCNINQTTGYGPGQSPFGGLVTITGLIPDAPDISSPNPLKYKVSVRQLSPPGPWQTVDNSFGVTVLEGGGGSIPVMSSMTQSVDADGYYTYIEDMNTTGAGWRTVYGRVLAHWYTAAPMDGMWQIKVEVKDHLGNIYPAAIILCSADGTTRQNVKLHLEQDPPEIGLKITGFTRPGLTGIQPVSNCATLQVGDTIHGEYKALDEHFGSLSLTLQPDDHLKGAVVIPAARSFPVVPTTGETGTWTINTTPMDPCGYTLRLSVSDRTLVNNGGSHWSNEEYIGFCLKAKP
jgi:hypothetical protein